MAGTHNFEHLPLLSRYRGAPKIRGGGEQSDETKEHKESPAKRAAHSTSLTTSVNTHKADWQSMQQRREQQGVPIIPKGIPLLLRVDPDLDIDVLRERFNFEIVAEQEEGFVIVAAEDLQLSAFLNVVKDFASEVRGSATIASVHELVSDPSQDARLKRLLSERLYGEWNVIADSQEYIVDIGIACTGVQEIPEKPERRKRETDAEWAQRGTEWSEAKSLAYEKWDDLKSEREAEIYRLIGYYQAEVLMNIDGAPYEAAYLPDSFTLRLKIAGRGLKDFILSYPYIFEVVEPEDIELPQRLAKAREYPALEVNLLPPNENAPAVCVIDSGIQEEHVLLEPAVDHPTSHCFLPDSNPTDIGDFVQPGGHGTRVAGAVLYGESIPVSGEVESPFWIQNARVLDQNNRMPVKLFPPTAIRAAVERFHNGPRGTRIFNHSINASGSCRTKYMSAWAAEIDLLCAQNDVLIVQSAGNLPTYGTPPYIGLGDHLSAGREYPAYLGEPSCRVANPAQSLQALTVGSIAYGAFETEDWRSFASEEGHPSAFSRSGFGIWNVIKPEVVEFGGDDLRNGATPPDIQSGIIPESCPHLVRSTMFPPGPATDRDEVGTSFAAPKVTRLAAQLQALLPNESSLLYRALIVQSARWPQWATERIQELLRLHPRKDRDRRNEVLGELTQILRYLGYGIPDEERATTNTDFRVTYITGGEKFICARECHIYEVPIPESLRRQADEFDILVEVTLSYVAQPRRTRRHLRRYLSTWVEWKSNKLGESLDEFRARALKDTELDNASGESDVFPWTLHENPKWGMVRDAKRSAGTVQKDWAVVKSNTLPECFCIAVVGHEGWSRDPESSATYALTVSLEIMGQEIAIYEPLMVAVQELQAEVESQAEVEVEIDS